MQVQRRAAMSARPATIARRAAVATMLAAWLAVGLWGGSVYVRRYLVYRGFPAPRTPAGVARGTLREVRFHSEAIGRDDRYLVYLPPHYAREAAHGRRFPVLYLLHGYPGNWRVFTNVGAAQVDANVLTAEHRMPPTIMVMPAGRQSLLDGDTEWADTSAGRWMDFVVDVVHDVDRRFATYPDRRHRGLAGDSEGGYAATNIALHHLPMFSVVEAWSGYFTQTPTAVFKHATTAQLRANSPVDYVASLAPEIRRLGLRAYLYQGRTEPTPGRYMQSFADALHRAGAEVRVGFFRGAHDWRLWRDELPLMLETAGHWFDSPPRARASLAQVGTALTDKQLAQAIRARDRRCVARVPGPGVKLDRACRTYRRRHPRAVRAAARRRHAAAAAR
jgi:enterochelin esterase-like enzyme